MKILLISMLVLVSCGSNYEFTRGTINKCQGKELADFIVKCAKAANPMSDEEGEDLVQQCEWTGQRIYCKEVKITCMSKYPINSCRGSSDYDIKEVK